MLNIKTQYPVIVNGNQARGAGKLVKQIQKRGGKTGRFSNADDISAMDDVSGIDASSPESSIKFFQSWYNKNKGGKLVVDGKWGPKTKAAWDEAGQEYDTNMKNFASNPFGAITASQGQAPAGTDTKDPKKKGKAGEKLKNLAAKAKDLGIADSLKDAFKKDKPKGKSSAPAGSSNTGDGGGNAGVEEPSTTNKSKWSTGKKILVFGGGSAVLVAIIWYVSKGKGKKTK